MGSDVKPILVLCAQFEFIVSQKKKFRTPLHTCSPADIVFKNEEVIHKQNIFLVCNFSDEFLTIKEIISNYTEFFYWLKIWVNTF